MSVEVRQDTMSSLEDRKIGRAGAKASRLGELREIARSFESIFMNMISKSMRATVKKGGFMDGGQGEEMFTGLLDSHIADEAAKRGKGLGIAEMIVKRYSKHLAAGEKDPDQKLDVTR